MGVYVGEAGYKGRLLFTHTDRWTTCCLQIHAFFSFPEIGIEIVNDGWYEKCTQRKSIKRRQNTITNIYLWLISWLGGSTSTTTTGDRIKELTGFSHQRQVLIILIQSKYLLQILSPFKDASHYIWSVHIHTFWQKIADLHCQSYLNVVISVFSQKETLGQNIIFKVVIIWLHSPH